jgi:hypothetical protein
MTPPVRGRFDPRLVGAPRTGTLPCGYELDDHPRLWRLERLTAGIIGGAFGLLTCGADPDDVPGQWQRSSPVMSQALGSSCQRPRPCPFR